MNVLFTEGSPLMTDRHSPSKQVIGAVLALTTLLTLLLAAFAWPSSQLEPRHVPVAVAGTADAARQLEAQLGQGLGAGAVEITRVGSRAEAVTAIEQRDVYGAIVLTPDGPEGLTASAGSPAIATLLGQVGTELGAASGSPPLVTDVAPLPEDDPRGATFAAGALPLALGGLAVAALLSLRVPNRGSRVAAVAGVALAAGPALTAVLQYWFGAVEGSYLANSGVVTLAVGSIAMMLIGLRHVFGPAGLGLGAATVLLLGNPLSGMTSAPELLPAGWSALGQLLPPGAAGSALRSTAFFDGAAALGPLTVLTGWLVIGLTLVLLPVRRGRTDPARRTVGDAGRTPEPVAAH
jgi:hypothetical protein